MYVYTKPQMETLTPARTADRTCTTCSTNLLHVRQLHAEQSLHSGVVDVVRCRVAGLFHDLHHCTTRVRGHGQSQLRANNAVQQHTTEDFDTPPTRAVP